MNGYLISIVTFLLFAGNLYPDRGKVKPAEENDALRVSVKANGTLRIAGKTYDREGIKEMIKALKERPDVQDPDNPGFVKIPLSITADDAAQYQHIQWLMMAAVRFGRIQSVIFKDPVDNNRRYTIPFPKALCLKAVPDPAELRDIRIILRTGEKDLTTLSIEKEVFAHFQSTGDKKGPEAAKAREENARIGRAVADKVKELLKARAKVPVIIDAAEEIRWEHVLKIVEVITPLDTTVEFVGNPKFRDLYY